MKKASIILIICAIVFTVFPINAKSQVVTGFTVVQTIGVPADDFIGSISLSEANFYEDYFHSEYLFPMQGVCATENGKVAVIDNSYGRIHILNGFLENESTFGHGANLIYPTDISFYNGKFYVTDALGEKVSIFGESGNFIGNEFSKKGYATGIAVNKNGIYVSYYFKGKIVKYSFNGVKQREAFVEFPGGLTSSGNNVYAISMSERSVFVFDKDLKLLKKISSEKLIFPSDVAVDRSGNIYVTDRGLSEGTETKGRIVKFSPSGSFEYYIGKPAESYPNQKDGTFLTPCGIAFSNGNIYVMDAGYYYWDSGSEAPFGMPIGARLSVFDTTGIFLAKKDWKHESVLVNPLDATLDGSGNIWVVNFGGMDEGNLVKYSPSGEFIHTISKINGQTLSYPYSVLSDKSGHLLVGGYGAIYVLDGSGHFIKEIKSSALGIVKKIIEGNDGYFYATLLSKNSVVKFSVSSGIISFYPVCKSPSGIAQSKGGNFYITSLDDNEIHVYSDNFHKIRTIGSSDPLSQSHLSIPEDVGIDKFGNIVVTDTEGGRLVVFEENGAFVYSSERVFHEPCSIEFEDGMLLVADCFHNTVKIVSEDTKEEQHAFFASVYPEKAVVRPAQKVFLTVSISNVGAVKDTYFLTIDKTYPPDWTVVADKDNITLSPGETGKIVITVIPPESASDGESVTLNVTVSSPKKSVFLHSIITVSTKLPPELTIPDTEIMHGDTVQIPVFVNGIKNVSGVSFTAVFPDGVSVLSASAGNLFADGLLLVSVEGNRVIFAVSEKGGKWKSGSGTVAVINVRGDTVAKGIVKFSNVFCVNPVGSKTEFEVKSGQISITPYLFVNFKNGANSSEQTFSFRGKTEPGAKLFVNGQKVSINSDGTFTAAVVLNKVKNTITIRAVYNGEETIIQKTVIFTGKKRIVIKLQIGNPVMTVNGVEMEIDPGRGTKPFIKPGWNRTLVPIRAIVEALGGMVGWEPKTRMVWIIFNTTEINMWIGNPQAKVNETPVWIDPSNHKVCPVIENSRTFIPIRFVAESMGCKVLWDDATKTVTIIYEE